MWSQKEWIPKITDDGDGNGPRIFPEPEEKEFYFRCVRPRGEVGSEFGDPSCVGSSERNWGLADFGKQKERLRRLLQPKLDAGMTAGGSV